MPPPSINTSSKMAGVDFLPVCDLLFNLISLTCYFCDVVFTSMVTYTLYSSYDGDGSARIAFFGILFISSTTSLLACQVISFRWYLKQEHTAAEAAAAPPASSGNRGAFFSWLSAVASHVLLAGVAWRYGRLLFAPVDVAIVKKEMRNLSILRLVHGFVASVPSVLVQGYIIAATATEANLLAAGSASAASGGDVLANRNQPDEYDASGTKIHVISAILSLFNICWGLASFNKNIRSRNLHRLILTWIGVIAQFLWRLGTIGSRCLCLVLYACAYRAWLFLFAFMHWVCMITWLQVMHHQRRQQQALQQQQSSFKARFLMSFIYMLDFINEDDCAGEKTRFRMGLFYVVVFIENMLLISLWSTNIKTTLNLSASDRGKAYAAAVSSFAIGLLFMALYYKLFHINKTVAKSSEASNGTAGTRSVHNGVANGGDSASSRAFHSSHEAKMNGEYEQGAPPSTVFNCALNPVLKKKKIPRVIPPPPAPGAAAATPTLSPDAAVPNGGGLMQRPFWKEPLPARPSEDREHSLAGSLPSHDFSRVKEKLQEKRLNEASYLERLTRANAAAIASHDSTRSLHHHFQENYSSGDQGDIDSQDEDAARYQPVYYTTTTSRRNTSETRL